MLTFPVALTLAVAFMLTFLVALTLPVAFMLTFPVAFAFPLFADKPPAQLVQPFTPLFRGDSSCLDGGPDLACGSAVNLLGIPVSFTLTIAITLPVALAFAFFIPQSFTQSFQSFSTLLYGDSSCSDGGSDFTGGSAVNLLGISVPIPLPIALTLAVPLTPAVPFTFAIAFTFAVIFPQVFTEGGKSFTTLFRGHFSRFDRGADFSSYFTEKTRRCFFPFTVHSWSIA
jgi:hypothetical protein